jgi:outer membrane protein assembly factor BamB
MNRLHVLATLVCVIFVFSLVLIPFGNADWTMFHGDPAHTGYSNASAGPTTSPYGPTWHYPIDSLIDWCQPTIANGILYAGGLYGHIYAVNAITGVTVWTCNTNISNEIRGSPAIANGVLYVGQNGGYFYALNATTGALIWKYTQPDGQSFVASPTVVNGKVYACDYEGNVYCFHALTNDTYWIKQVATGAIYSSPAVVNGVVYVAGYTDHNVYALDASTGNPVWAQPFTTGSLIYSSPSVANGIVYIGSWDYYLYAIDAQTGQQVWNFSTGGGVQSCPAIVGNVVYFASDDGNVYACNAQTGASIWNFTTVPLYYSNTGIWASPVIAGNTLYIGTMGYRFYAINATNGTQLWVSNLGYVVYGSAAVADGLVYYIIGGEIEAYGTPTVPPTVSVSPTSWTMDSSQSETFTASAVGGSGTYSSYQWYVDGVSQSGSTAPTFTYYPSDTSPHSITATATDNLGATSAQSPPAVVTVNSDPSISISPIISGMEVGQSQTFTASVSGGSGSFSYQWYLNDATIANTNSATYNFVPTSAGSASIWCRVIDSASAPMSAYSNTLHITVSSAPTVTITPGSTTMDVGQSKVFTANPTGGSGTYTNYQWYVGGSPQSGQTASTFSFTPASPGSYSITATVTDSLGATSAQSAAPSVTVAASPTVSIAPVGPLTLTVGQVQAFTATPSGGSGTINYQWYLDGAAVGSNSASYSYTAAGTSHSVTCKVTDSASTPVTSPASNAVSVTVNPTPTPAPTSSPTPTATPQPLTATATSSSGTSVTVTAGNSVTCTATVSGGTAPYHYQWEVYVSPNSTVNSYVTGQTSAKLNVSQTVPGTYTYFLLVFDANGQVTTSNKVTLTVTQSSPTPSPTTTPTPTPTLTPTATAAAFVFSASDWYWLIVVIVIIIVLFFILLAWYRRRRNLTVTVQNSQTLSPISGASVSASGPKPLSGTTGSDGQIVFSNVKAGNYAIKASATGYNSSIPVSVSVTNKTNYVIKLDSIASKTQETQTK